MANFFKVAKLADIPQGEMIGVNINDKTLAIANIDGELFAFDSECTHAAAWLHEGFLENSNVQCPLHFAEFDVRSGDVMEPPATLPVKTYAVRIQEDDVEVEYPN